MEISFDPAIIPPEVSANEIIRKLTEMQAQE
jgi:hypothetical protein